MLNLWLKEIIPDFLLNQYRSLKSYIKYSRNRKKTAEEIFTEIYEMNQWGGEKGKFCSGDGSSNTEIVSPYITMIAKQASLLHFKEKTFVDLGCGDFTVGKQLLPLCARYIGVDVVKPLIESHQKAFSNDTTVFIHRDITQDELPDGDVCFVRQVFQHLSNEQIAAILKKLSKYDYVFITEHYPGYNDNIKPNIDKAHGSDIRVYFNSGVYLSAPPFNLPEESLAMVLEVPGVGLDGNVDQGLIRTFRYILRR